MPFRFGTLLLALIASGCLIPTEGALRSRIQRSPLHRQHRVTSLPGFQGQFKSDHYAGYLTVDEERGRKLFYYLVESERQPDKDPLVLWLNGGPGCSSFDGFVWEHGPFSFAFRQDTDEVSLTHNPYAWSKVANVLYLDSPAGVGLSYSQFEEDYITNDTQTAKDADVFLRKFFKVYPQFLKNPFYITGESYAGIYVPNLALSVMKGNNRGEVPFINLLGYMVGNGCTDDEYDGNAIPLFALGKSLISNRVYQSLLEACQGNFWNATEDSTCGRRLARMMNDLSDLNLYDILQPCYHGASTRTNGLGGEELQQKHLRYRQLRASYPYWPVTGVIPVDQPVRNWNHLLGFAPPCTDTRLGDAWLNLPEVRQAIHADPLEVSGPWTLCTARITYTHDAGSMIPVHRQLTEEFGLRALIYSGDHDLCVPHTGSEAWTRGLGRSRLATWQPWFVEDHQVAGYVVEYEGNLTYATVKGAGHMVPETNPVEALAMFSRFVEGVPLYPQGPPQDDDEYEMDEHEFMGIKSE